MADPFSLHVELPIGRAIIPTIILLRSQLQLCDLHRMGFCIVLLVMDHFN